MKVKSIAIPAVALFVGIGIGASDDPVVAAPAAAKPKVVTKTVTKTVEVPGPERVVEVVPGECATAIAQAREVARGTGVFAEGAGIYPPLVGQAFEAGVNGDLDAGNAIIAEMQQANSKLDEATAIVGPAVDAFNAAAAQCQA